MEPSSEELLSWPKSSPASLASRRQWLLEHNDWHKLVVVVEVVEVVDANG